MYGTAEKLKRALAMLLTILMLESVLPVASFAETGSGDPPPRWGDSRSLRFTRANGFAGARAYAHPQT